jgi:hypothetical protein
MEVTMQHADTIVRAATGAVTSEPSRSHDEDATNNERRRAT